MKRDIPAWSGDGRSRLGRMRAEHLRAVQGRLGPLPREAWPTLDALGLVVVELYRQQRELEASLKRRRMRDARRTRRSLVILRTQLLTLEKRLEEIAAAQPRDWADLLNKAGR